MLFDRAGGRKKDSAFIEALEARRLLAAIYFVSPSGDDAANGRTPATAWKTIDRVNAKNWNPGDQVLFEGGQRFPVIGTRGDNFLPNGDFELGLTGWGDSQGTVGGNSVITNDPTLVHGGTSALALGTGAAARAQDITAGIQPDQTYEIDVWTKVVKPGVGADSVGVTFTRGGVNIGTFYRSFRNTEYNQTNFDFVAPIGFDTVTLWANKTSDTSTFYVDDVSIQTIPNGLIFDANDSGTAQFPVLIGTWGNKKPAKISAGDGNALTAINSSGLRIQNLIVVGSWNAIVGSGASAGSGIEFVNSQPGNVKLPFVLISNVEAKGFRSTGIRIGGWNGKSGFSDVTIVNSRVRWNGNTGIMFRGERDLNSSLYSHTNVYVGKNRVSNNTGVPDNNGQSGNGILIDDVDGAIVERNVAWQNGELNNYTASGPVGIWAFDANNVKIQYNESFENHTNSTHDGGGFDLDGAVTNSVVQYNYSHDNDGPGFLIGQFAGFRAFGNNVVRYNISQNDARKNSYGAITLTGTSGLKDSIIEHNTVYLDKAASGTSSAVRVKAAGSGISLSNNIFMTTGGAPVVVVDTGATAAAFNGNDYWSGGGAFEIRQSGSAYGSLAAWQTTGEEMLSTVATGFQVDPGLNDPGTASAILSIVAKKSLPQYQLQTDSPMKDAALDLPLPWNNYGSSATDFFINPALNGTKKDIGAAES